MSQQKVLYKKVRFRRTTTGCTQTARPTLSTADEIGQVLTVSTSREGEEAVFEKAIGGKWVDYAAVNQRAREITTVTVGELSELYWELVRGCSVVLTGGGASYVPNSTVTTLGWFQIITSDDAGNTIDDVQRWCKVDITSAEHPQTGYAQATFTVRTLYSHADGNESSPLNVGTFANIS